MSCWKALCPTDYPAIWIGPTQLCQAPSLATSRAWIAPTEQTVFAVVSGRRLPTGSRRRNTNRCKQCLFVHEAYPGGPRRYVLEGKWFKVVGVCPIANTTLVRYCPSMPFNTSSKFVFLDACYQHPVAIWPHDPLGDLPLGDRRKDWFDVIDRNQCESYA